jgi:DNA-binding FrmR family transcriptional regulator
VRTGVEFPDEDEEPGYDQLQQIHLNAQASYVLLSLLDKDEFDRVNSLEKAKDIWDTLQRAHEVTKLIKKAKRQLVEGQLDRFVMLHDESPQDIYNSVKKLVNKVRAYVCRRWGGQRMIKRRLRACVVKDTTVIFLIQQDPNFKRMTPVDILGKIVNHEMLIEEANHVKNLSKDITSSKKQDIAFKASKKGKSKKVVEESLSEEEEDDDDDESTECGLKEMALFIRRFFKMVSKQKFFKGANKDKLKPMTKKACYNCGKYDHYIANCPHEEEEEPQAQVP